MPARSRSSLAALLTALTVLLSLAALAPAAQATVGVNGVAMNSYESDLLVRTNAARAAAGLPGLSAQNGTTDVARQWAGVLAQRGALSHNPDLAVQIQGAGSAQWTAAAENVGQGGSSAAVFAAYMNSAPHKANILRSNVSTVGVGAVASADGRVWDVMVFTDAYDGAYGAGRTTPMAVDAGAAPAPVAQPGRFIQARDTANPGAAPYAFEFGSQQSTTLSCDFNGDGRDDIAAYQNGHWSIRFAMNSGVPDLEFDYGFPGATPVCGNWDGTGADGIGVYYQGTWYLRNTASAGNADAGLFDYGNADARPVVGDWDGNGTSTVGVVFGGSYWMLRNGAGPGQADMAFSYGFAGGTAVSGDWNGNSRSGIGIFANGTWYLRDDPTPGPARVFSFGGVGSRPVTGNWDGTPGDGVAISWGP